MKCRTVTELLPEYTAGELTENIAAQAREHIEGCESCRAESARFASSLAALASPRGRVPAPTSLVCPRIPVGVARPWLRPAFVATVVAALLLLGLLYCRPQHPDAEPRPDVIAHMPADRSEAPIRVPDPVRTHVPRGLVPVRDHTAGAGPMPRPQWTPNVKRPNLVAKVAVHTSVGRMPEKPHTFGVGQVTEPEPVTPMGERPEVSTQHRKVLVIASMPDVVKESSIEMRTVDRNTGEVTIYSRKHAASGEDQSVHLRFHTSQIDPDRRHPL